MVTLGQPGIGYLKIDILRPFVHVIFWFDYILFCCDKNIKMKSVC